MSVPSQPRSQPPRQPGAVLWITGLSASGKTTLGRLVHAELRKSQPHVVRLDGDDFREIIGDGIGHTPDERLRNAMRIARFCRYLSGQGIDVVCSTMSLFHECQSWNRTHLERYFEVYLRVPMDVLKRRDPKGLYERAMNGEVSGVVGVDLPFEPPLNPTLVLDNAGDVDDLESQRDRILRAFTTYLATAQRPASETLS